MLLEEIAGHAVVVHPCVMVYVYPKAKVIKGHATHAFDVAFG
jgi:hypothetical protein